MSITLCIEYVRINFSLYSMPFDPIQEYFDQFDSLSKSEDWKEILSLGTKALDAARSSNRVHDEAKICAQLTSTAFYMGDYPQALIYANRCHELSTEFSDPTLFLRALYLESAVNRALAGKSKDESEQQDLFKRAVDICEEAASIYLKSGITDLCLQGKIYFNLGAAHADNPLGDKQSALTCYSKALECFKKVNGVDDIVRTSLRIGKLQLLEKQYDLTQEILEDVRPYITTERIKMQADYLEAQLKQAQNDIDGALKIARNGLDRAIALGAKEDELRFSDLVKLIALPR